MLRPSNWKFEPSPKTHAQSDPIINKTHKKLHILFLFYFIFILFYFILFIVFYFLSWHALNSVQQVKTFYWKARIWLPVHFKNNSRHTHQNPLKPSPVSERSAYPLQTYAWAGPRMMKDQLSRVPWPGSSWMAFTFQPVLQTLQQPHKHSHAAHLLRGQHWNCTWKGH